MGTSNEYPNIAEMTAEQLQALIAKDDIDPQQFEAATERLNKLRKKG